ncbi:hypothetical protein PUN28_010055 [Cardiocondyla obscurior]
MKFTLILAAVLAVSWLGQAQPILDSSTLREDVRDFLTLIPSEEINEILTDYITGDSEVRSIFNYLLSSPVLPDLMMGVEAIPEVINLMNYLQKREIDIYSVVNKIHKILGIDELVPPSYFAAKKRTGGVAGLFEDIKKVIPFAKFIRTYVQKMKTSPAFVDFVNQLKSDSFQQLVNKLYQVESFQIIVNGLKSRGVNTQIVADIMYIVLGITVPNGVSVYQKRTLNEELTDFVELIPEDKFSEVVIKYVIENEEVGNAFMYILTPEFQSILHDVEALEEYQALMIYFENAGLKVIDSRESLHKAIGKKDYMQPKVEIIFKSEIGMQVGSGIKALLADLYDLLPLDEINALYNQKMQNSKVFSDFVKKLESLEFKKLLRNLSESQTYKNFILITNKQGLELEEIAKFVYKIFGFKIPYIN